ncbi:MAG: hypothetical protein GXP46_05440 [Deferribacteres bacterium]|nr:hypothetical protein [Deferribacteres bacterium]
MKESYNNLKKELLDINGAVASLLSVLRSRTDITDARFDDWQKACTDIHHQITEEVVRVAVIGPVKSGKSTFVNSLFKGDYLKRGAGVVTSIVTRIRSGENLKAVLYFKSWDDVNADIEQALVMLPSWEGQSDEKSFDIRREKDRRLLRRAVEGLSDDLLITDGTRNINSVLLSLYLKGYDKVSGMITADSVTTEFSGEHFAEHQTFVSDDSLAVYLKDIELEINNVNIDHSIEIADCQGSDSPNPLHLAMIQDYLMRTHFIVYVISSRTGLREADIRFLSMIKKMGIIENILFVLNIDFSEHESLNDLKSLIEKVREELALIKPDPDVYSFSALFNLFSALSGSLTKRDKLRLGQWKAEKDFVSFANKETARFNSSLKSKLSEERFRLLLKNHLERMSVIVFGVERWVSTNRELLAKDVNGASEMIKNMKYHQERMEQIKTLIKSTLSGATWDIMKGLKKDIDAFFNYHPGGVLEQTSNFVEQYTISVEKYREKIASSGFFNTLYLVFQEFKQALDKFMTETINPEIARFSGEVDARIQESLESVALPFYSMVSDDIAELKATIGKPSGKEGKTPGEKENLLNINALKQITGLSLPLSTAAIRYSAKIKTETLMRLGIYSAIKLFKKVLKKTQDQEREEQMRALADGFKLIKSETEKLIVFHFENYRENFKFQYASKLVDAASKHLHQILMERFQSFNTDLRTMEEVMKKKGSDREEMINFLDSVSVDVRRIKKSIDKCRAAIEQ